ncbi:hypothetical protein DIC82_02515 [Clostridium beijerinckii]|nr:hypothetical protein DIC82_02515 [Clostridium beijerinckii]
MHMKRIYKFSIIIPIYNSGKYLEECIDSVINQKNIKFEEDVQLILVNDGSEDNSEEICLKFKKLYVDNIVYIEKENEGVSSARNKGLEVAEGQYINFLDSDDMLSSNTLENIEKFFLKHGNEIDVVSIPIYFFEGKNESHLLNYKFNKGEIIDIQKYYDFIQMSISGTFIKYSRISDKKFKEELKYGEDAYLITSIILEKNKYGVLKDAKYLYRYRSTMESTMQESWRKKEWFLESMDKFTLDLINLGNRDYRTIPKYLQYIILYDLSWKVSVGKKAKDTLTDEELSQYFDKLRIALKSVKWNVILKYKRVNKKCMIILYLIKYCNADIFKEKYIKFIWDR